MTNDKSFKYLFRKEFDADVCYYMQSNLEFKTELFM